MTARAIADDPQKLYLGADVPLRLIRAFARKVAEQFRPDKIILFGSHAYGTPHEGSDVDILVIMPARNELDQSLKISLAVTAPFPMDLIVRTPQKISSRLKSGDSFHTEIVTKGRVLYEERNARVGAKSGRRPRGVGRATRRAGSAP